MDIMENLSVNEQSIKNGQLGNAFHARLGDDVIQRSADKLSDINNVPYAGYEAATETTLKKAVESLIDPNILCADQQKLRGDDPAALLNSVEYCVRVAHKETEEFAEKCRPGNVQYKEEIAAVHLYTQSDPKVHAIVNNLLREAKNQNEIKQWFPYIRLLMRGMESLQVASSKTVYRGVKEYLTSEYPLGSVFRWDTFTSTTSDSKVLENEALMGTTKPRTLFMLRTQTGAEISQVSRYKNEAEVLMRPGTVFQVTGVVPRSAEGLGIVMADEIGSLAAGATVLKGSMYTKPQYKEFRILDFEPITVPLRDIYTDIVSVETGKDKSGVVDGSVLTVLKPTESRRKHLTNMPNIIDDKQHSAINMNDLFGSHGTVQRVVVYGRAGIGKTTYTSKLLRDWCDGKTLSQFQWVLRIILRNPELNDYGNCTLAKVIHRFCFHSSPHLTTAAIDHLLQTRGSHILLILDGYDEYRGNVPALTRLIEQHTAEEKYSKLCLLVTSRPAVLHELAKNQNQHASHLFDREVEIVGFGVTQVRQFIKRFFAKTDSKKAEMLINALQTHTLLEGLARIPVLAAIICVVYSGDTSGDASTTQGREVHDVLSSIHTITDLYDHLKRNVQARMKNKCREIYSLEPSKDHVEGAWNIVAKMAWDGLQTRPHPQLIFDASQLQNALELVCDEVKNAVEHGGWLTRSGHTATPGHTVLMYCFMHLTLQEYAAASYIVRQPFPESHFHSSNLVPQMHMVARFVCGLLGENAHHVIRRLLGDNTDLEMQFVPSGRRALSKSTKILILQCCMESKCPAIQKEYIPHVVTDGALDLSGEKMTPMDVEGLGNLLCFLEDFSGKHNIRLERLDISGCGILEAEYRMLQIALAKTKSLVHLNMSNNSITDVGVIALTSEFLAKSTSLRQLNLGFNLITKIGAIALAKALTTNKKLEKLQLEGNSICNDGAVELANALTQNNSLQYLDLKANSITDVGAEALACSLTRTTSLRHLQLQGNSISHTLRWKWSRQAPDRSGRERYNEMTVSIQPSISASDRNWIPMIVFTSEGMPKKKHQHRSR